MKIPQIFTGLQCPACDARLNAVAIRSLASAFLLLGLLAGCDPAGAGGATGRLSKTEVARMKKQLLSLEWEICNKWSATYGIATAPVIPGRTIIVPSTATLEKRYQVKRGPTLYPKDGVSRISKLHKEIDQLNKQYRAIAARLKNAGHTVPKLPKCSVCKGRRVRYGPHYELGRRPDGSLGMVFKMGGLHRCASCGGTGITKPGTAARKNEAPIPP